MRHWLPNSLSLRMLHIGFFPHPSLASSSSPSPSPSPSRSLPLFHKLASKGNQQMEPPSFLSDSNSLDHHPSEDPHAELCAAHRRCISPIDIGSSLALSEWLSLRLANGPDFLAQWGKTPGTKRVANLWLELSEGEISLEDSVPPKRTVHVACVKITNGRGDMLLESHQELSDGSLRQRNRPLSEKMKPGESIEEACLRGIREELGVDLGLPTSVKMLRHTYRREEQERESFSYPGLMTCYVLHHMEALMQHLPGDDFVTVENEYNTDSGEVHSSSCYNGGIASRVTEEQETVVGVKKHFWKWVPESSI